jgi:DNA polymerase-3 subunit delta'
MTRLTDSEMAAFCTARNLPDAGIRVALAEGSPGVAATLNLDTFRERRALLLAAFECGSGVTPFSSWIQQSESFANRKSEKLDYYLKMAYGLLEDVLAAGQGKPPVQHRDIQPRIAGIAQRVDFSWIEQAVKGVDELTLMVRRNIQKTGALDAMIINLRNRLTGQRA